MIAPESRLSYTILVDTLIGFGTERIEDDIKLIFPEAKVARMDLDGQIIYDHWSENNNNTPEETAIRYAAFKNKIVLSHSSGGEFANEVTTVCLKERNPEKTNANSTCVKCTIFP